MEGEVRGVIRPRTQGRAGRTRVAATSWRACSNSGSGARLDMVDKVALVVVMKSRGGRITRSFFLGMAGEEVEVDEICTNEGMEDIDLSLYIRSELALRPVTSPPHPPLVCSFGFNLSLSSTAQLPSASPRSLSVSVALSVRRMVRRECRCSSPGLDPSSYTHTQRL
jgi:hypothetical protein